jgi:two-component system, LytTR family, sensor kinase
MNSNRHWLRRDELGLPTFWPLQLCGWVGFYVLNLLSAIPSLGKPGTVRENTLFVIPMFAASCLLRPVCRSLRRRELSWIALEVRASGYSLLFGAVAGYLEVAWTHGTWRTGWQDPMDMMLVSVIVLFTWCSLYFNIKQWQQAARSQQRAVRAESEAREARLRALRYQLNPHMLFNSLNAVSTLILEGDAASATRMLARIAELLRSILDARATSEAPLSQEIAFINQYLAIEQIRLGDRLRAELDIAPETLDALIPTMLLQPLVENAVRHGVAPVVGGGSIRLESRLQHERVRIEIVNTGPPRASEPQTGIGLANTAERLKTLYAGDQQFHLQWPEQGGCRVSIDLPFRRGAMAGELAA